MPLLFVHPPPLLLLVLAVFPRSHSVSKSPFVSCPLNPPSLIPFLPLGPNLALRLSSQSISRYLLCNITYSNIECKAIRKKVIEMPLCLASLMFLLCYFCKIPSPSLSLSLSPLSMTLSVSFLSVLHEACKAGTQMCFLDHNLFTLSE